MAHTGKLEMVAEASGAIIAGDFWEWHFAMVWDFIGRWLQCLEVLWLGFGSMLDKQNGDCGEREYELWAINARVVSDSDWMSRLGFPLIANSEVFEMLQNAKRGCGNFAPLGSYETVAFAASMAILWVIVVLHEVGVQFTTVIVAFVFRGILAYGFGHFSWFSAYFANEWFALR